MKIIIRIIIAVVFIVFMVSIGEQIITQKNKEKQIVRLPEMKLKNIYNIASFASMRNCKKNLIINYFNTHCDFCQHEIQDFKNHLHLFPNTQIMLVSAQQIDTLKLFAKSLSLDTISQIDVFHCDYPEFIENFGEVSPPTTFVYDSNKYLIKKYKGQIRAPVVAEDIKAYYTKNNELFK